MCIALAPHHDRIGVAKWLVGWGISKYRDGYTYMLESGHYLSFLDEWKTSTVTINLPGT